MVHQGAAEGLVWEPFFSVSAHRFKCGPHGWVGVPAALHELSPAWRWLSRLPLLPSRHEIFGIWSQQEVGSGGALHVLLLVQASIGKLPCPEFPHDDSKGVHVNLQEQCSCQALRAQEAYLAEAMSFQDFASMLSSETSNPHHLRCLSKPCHQNAKQQGIASAVHVQLIQGFPLSYCAASLRQIHDSPR